MGKAVGKAGFAPRDRRGRKRECVGSGRGARLRGRAPGTHRKGEKPRDSRSLGEEPALGGSWGPMGTKAPLAYGGEETGTAGCDTKRQVLAGGKHLLAR